MGYYNFTFLIGTLFCRSSLTFTAADTQDGIFATGKAQVSLNGATLKAGNINISATSTVSGFLDNIAALVALDSTATISLVDSRIEGSGNVTIASSSVVNGSAIAKGLSSQIDTAKDAAVAILDIDSSAIANVSGTSSIVAGGSLSLTAINRDSIAISLFKNSYIFVAISATAIT